MKKIYQNIFYILFTVVLIIFLTTNKPCGDVNNTDSDTIVIRDTIEHVDTYSVTVNNPVPYIVNHTVTDSFMMNVDTAQILHDFYNELIYIDTLVNDSSLFAVIRDTVTRNMITGRGFDAFVRCKTIINNITINNGEEAVNKLFIGPSVSSYAGKLGAGVCVSFFSKNEKMYSLNADLVNRNATFGYLFKLKIKKRK